MKRNLQKVFEDSTLPEEQKYRTKRCRSSTEQETERGRKRTRLLTAEKQTREQAPKRDRTSENEEEQGLSKRAKMSSGKKRCRTSDNEEKCGMQKKQRISSENQGEQTFCPGGDWHFILKPKKPLGQSLDDYQFHSELGQGGFGKVMLASLKDKNQPVAVKVINKEMHRSELVRTERNILQMAGDSPFLCRGLAAFQTQEHSYLVMEHMSGGSLQSRMDKRGQLGLTASRFYLAEIICGMQYLHSHGIIHRDLKPDNILLDGDGHIKIADFGLAVENISGDSKTQGRAGTLRYMAPEVISNKPYGASADWWSLGVILCRMMTNRYPINDKLSTPDYIQEVLTASPRYPAWLPSDAVDLLDKLLDKDPESRLGVNGNIRDHPFFRTINWEEIENRKAIPPSVPFTDLEPNEQYYSFMDDDSSVTEGHIIPNLSFVVPEWKE